MCSEGWRAQHQGRRGGGWWQGTVPCHTLKQAQQEREDHDYDRTRSMVKNWKRANLVKSIDTATYEKNPETWNVVSGKG